MGTKFKMFTVLCVVSYEMLAIAFNLKSGLSTSEKRLNFESTLQPTKVYHVILQSRDI